MGFGHRVYKTHDPRAKVMQQVCNTVLGIRGQKYAFPCLLKSAAGALEYTSAASHALLHPHGPQQHSAALGQKWRQPCKQGPRSSTSSKAQPKCGVTELLYQCRSDPLLDIAMKLEEVALQDDYFVSRHLYPNVDFYSGIVLRALGIPVSMYTVLFAVSAGACLEARGTTGMTALPGQDVGMQSVLCTEVLLRVAVSRSMPAMAVRGECLSITGSGILHCKPHVLNISSSMHLPLFEGSAQGSRQARA